MKAKLLKIALAIGSDKDKRKKVVYVILMVVFILSLPILVAYGIANGNFEINYTEVELRVTGNYVDTTEWVDVNTKNNLDLVKWAEHAAKYHWGYVYGTYGSVFTDGLFESKLKQYPDEVGKYQDFISDNYIGIRTSDCVGLIKGYGWFDPEHREVVYGYGNMKDVSADGMYNAATEKGTIDTIPEIPGLAVWHHGHIGIYVGNGYVVQAANTKVGVIRTPVGVSGWTHWLKIPYIEYLEETEND